MSNCWHTVKVKYTKQFQNGTLKRVTEPYLVNSISFTDAEARIHQEVGDFCRGEFMVTSIARENFADIFHYEDREDWYQATVMYVSEDVDSGREKKISNTFLVTAESTKEASDRIEESLKGLMVEFEITALKKTKIVEIFPYQALPGEELVESSIETQENTNESYSAEEE